MATEALGLKLVDLLLAHGKSAAICICELIDAMQTLHTLDELGKVCCSEETGKPQAWHRQ